MTQLRSITDPSYFRSGKNEEVAAIGENLIVKAGSAVDGILLATGAGVAILGVTVEPIGVGRTQSYQVDGKAVVKLGDTVTPGQLLTSDSAGRAVPVALVSSTTTRILGRAVTGGIVNELAEVELYCGGVGFIGASTVATRAAVKALTASQRYDGQLVTVAADFSMWIFAASSTTTPDTAQEILMSPDAGTGKWVRADKAFTMKVPVDFSMADGATIQTVPEGFCYRLTGLPYWECTIAWAGGSSSAIGVASNKTGYTTAGDILGGASGDVAAGLVAGINPGTIGPKLDTLAEIQAFLMEEGDTLTYEEITSAFTSGAGYVCVPVSVATAPATP